MVHFDFSGQQLMLHWESWNFGIRVICGTTKTLEDELRPTGTTSGERTWLYNGASVCLTLNEREGGRVEGRERKRNSSSSHVNIFLFPVGLILRFFSYITWRTIFCFVLLFFSFQFQRLDARPARRCLLPLLHQIPYVSNNKIKRFFSSCFFFQKDAANLEKKNTKQNLYKMDC